MEVSWFGRKWIDLEAQEKNVAVNESRTRQEAINMQERRKQLLNHVILALITGNHVSIWEFGCWNFNLITRTFSLTCPSQTV